MILDTLFNKYGNFIMKGFDPYRVDHSDEFYKKIFDDEGYLKEGLLKLLGTFLHNSDPNFVSYDCDVVSLIHAERFARNTKNNYSTIYYWR